jgi:hypothetical protein
MAEPNVINTRSSMKASKTTEVNYCLGHLPKLFSSFMSNVWAKQIFLNFDHFHFKWRESSSFSVKMRV